MIRIETSADHRFRSIVNPENPIGARIIRSEPVNNTSGSTAIADTRLRVWAKRNGMRIK